MVVADVAGPGPWGQTSDETMQWLAGLLREEGTDLMDLTPEQARKATPVFVEADADVEAVESLMTRHGIQVLPVVRGASLIGVIDLIDLESQDGGAHGRVITLEDTVAVH